MKDELISFETAKLAKEKGFNWKNIEILDVKRKSAFLDSTTRSLLQRWLREVHNIKLWNEFGYTNEWFCYYLNKYDDKIQLTTNLRSATYEEALEVGLQEALKLIKK